MTTLIGNIVILVAGSILLIAEVFAVGIILLGACLVVVPCLVVVLRRLDPRQVLRSRS